MNCVTTPLSNKPVNCFIQEGCQPLLSLACRSYPEAAAELDDMGFATTLEYLAAAAAAVLAETGLLPHINAGVMAAEDVRKLRAVSVSQGLMLESTSEALLQPGGAHFNCPDKVCTYVCKWLGCLQGMDASSARVSPPTHWRWHLPPPPKPPPHPTYPTPSPSNALSLPRHPCADTGAAPSDHRGGGARGRALHHRHPHRPGGDEAG
jgi:hypothetical protein